MWSWIVLGWVVLSSLGWVLAYGRSLRAAHAFPLLDDLRGDEPATWPTISVIVPACNEADTLEPALRSLLQVDYPELEIVAIDDRSNDGTGPIIDRLGAKDARLRPLHIQELPEGWLGKTHALYRGVQAASGDWLLFTDADVHFRSDALRRAMAVALAHHLDHLTLAPEVHMSGLWANTLYDAFAMLLMLTTELDAVADPDSDAYMGVGAFNLVRAQLLREGPGLEHLRMEIADDVGIGLLVHDAGGLTGAAFAPGILQLEWYPSLGGMIRGLRKNSFAVMCRFSYSRAVASVLFGLAFVLGPFAGVTLGLADPTLAPWAWLASGLAFAALCTHAAYIVWRWDRRPLPQLLGPVGLLLVTWTMARSAAHYWRRGGVDWRGTHYDIDELRANQRVLL